MTTPTYRLKPLLGLRPRTAAGVIRRVTTLAAVTLGICAAAVSANASVLAGWDMSGLAGGSGNYGPSPFAANTTDPNLTVGGLTRGTGVGTSGTGAAKAWGGNAWNVTSESAAISGNLYATFTITPKAGYKVSLSDIAAYNIRRSGTGPTTGIWQYQVGSGPFTDIGSSSTWGNNTTSTGNPQGSVDLSGISALQDVPAGTTITIRMVNWNASGASGTWYFNGQGTSANLTFNGTVSPLDLPPDPPVANDPGSVTSSAFAANWTASAGATGYLLDVSTSSSFASFVSGYNNLDVGNVTSSAVTGLSANTTYYYRLRAYNTSGTSGNSNVKSAITSGSVAATKMTVTLPGQPFANTGTPNPQSAGTPFNVTLTAVLNNGTTVDTTYSGGRNITFSGPTGSPVYPASVTFNSGVGVASIVLNKAESTTLTATDSLLTGIASSTFTVNPAVYHWVATTDSASWTNAASWSPARVAPGTDDTLLFDQGGTSTATDVSTATIVSLQVSNNTSVTLQAGASATLNIGGGANAFSVTSGSALSASGPGAVTISLSSGTSGTISGAITFASGAHRLLAVDAGSITFASGASFTADTGFSGNAFGTTSLNSIVFAAGSTYIQKAGSNPFGASQPSSVVTFQTGSLYRVAANQAPSFSGRTYADLEINAAAFNQSSTGGGILTMDNLNVADGTLNLNLTGGINIKGNVTVAAGQTLTFSPASTASVSFNGTAPQTITGGGTINFGSSSVNVPAGSTLLVETGIGTASGTSITVDGALGGNSSITGPGIVTINPDGTLAPGASIGTLTFDTAPVLQGAASMQLDRNASPNADQIAVTGGSFTYGGSLVLTNVGAALADGDSFTLFTASGFNGWFSAVIAPGLGSGLTLDTNKLSETGILDVYSFTPGSSVPLSVVKNVAADLPVTTVFAHTAGGRGALALAAATGASHGVLSTNATTITYTPDSNYVGTDSFICSVADTNNGLANVTVAVTVTGSGGGNTSTLAIQQSGTNFSVTVTGNAGSNYQLQRSAALAPTNWQPVGAVFTMPTGGSTNISVTPAGSTGFYRTVVP